MDTPIYQAAIIGAGPIGIELAVALTREGIDYIHFDANQVGHTVAWFAPGTRFFSSNERIAIAGVPLVTADQSKATREEYLAYLRAVVMQFDLKVNCFEKVEEITRRDGWFEITTQRRGTVFKYRVRKLALSTGGTDRPRMLNIPGENLPHVSHYFHDPHLYFRQRLLVVGGKNSAVEAALRAYGAGAKVAVSYRGEKYPEESIKYWLLPEINGHIKSGKIEAHFKTNLVKISNDNVTLRRGDETFDVPADFVLLMTGYIQDNVLLRKAGVELTGEQHCPVFDEQTMETNVPGVYIAGTATAGTQAKYRVFIENCHVHVEKIVKSIKGEKPPTTASVEYAQPET